MHSENPRGSKATKSYEAYQRREKALKRNAKRREWERQQQGKNKGFENTLMIVFGVGFVLYMLAVLAIGIAWPLVLLTGGIIAGTIISYVV